VIEARKMVRTLETYNAKFVSINAVGATKYALLPPGTDVMEEAVNPCKDKRREMTVCAVETKMWKIHDAKRTLLKI
jgi:hypothetical protein